MRAVWFVRWGLVLSALAILILRVPAKPGASSPRPNLFLQLSAGLLNTAAERPVHRVKPVRDCILGTRICGTSLTRGKSFLELVPDSSQAVVDLVVTGQSWTDTVGRNGPVRLFSLGTFCYEVRQRVFLDPSGVRATAPCAKARGHSKLVGLMTDYRGMLDRLIKRVALRRYEESKPLAFYIADRHAEKEYEEEMDRDSRPELEKRQREFSKGLDDLKKYDIERQQLQFSTTVQALHIAVRIGPGLDPSVLQVPGEVKCSADLGVRVHESVANRLARERLAGKTLTEKSIREQRAELESLLGRPARQDEKKESKEEPWSITFDTKEPVIVRFAEGQIEAVLKLTEFTSEDNLYPAMNVTIQYEFKETAKGFVARRKGTIEILPPDFVPGKGKRLSARQIAMATVLRKQLERVFPEETVLEDLELRDELKKAGPLKVVQADPNNGWLIVAWQRKGSASKTTD